MTMKDKMKVVNSDAQSQNFETQWQFRQQWEEQAEKSVPDDETFLIWAEKAQQSAMGSERDATSFPFRRKKHWIPYTAAASIVIAVAIIGLSRSSHSDNGFPTAKEVIVESQTIHFLCNNGCSAQDVMILAGRVIK